MRFDIITIFPNLMEAVFSESILAKAKAAGLIEIHVHDLREFTLDQRRTIDGRPFGGGPGMLMMLEPIYKILRNLEVYPTRPATTKVILTSARGETWQQPLAETYAADVERMVIICGHYEGVDHRVVEHLIDAEISIGNYVLTGGELAAGVLVDSIARLIPGVVGNPLSIVEESHSAQAEINTEYPQYTRPAEFTTAEGETWGIPEILLSGNHAEIAKWRSEKSK
jgi:tRNA (guanine37-N1)-methyltransferase